MWLLSSGFTWGIHRFKLFAATLRSSSLNISERSGCMLAVIVFSAIPLNQNSPLYMQHEQRETDSGAYTMPPHNRTDYRLDVIAFHCIPCNLLLDRPECFPCHHRLDWPNCTPSALLARWLDPSHPGSMTRWLPVRLPARWPDCTPSALLARWPESLPSWLDGPIALRTHYRLAGPIRPFSSMARFLPFPARWPDCFPSELPTRWPDLHSIGSMAQLFPMHPSQLPTRWPEYLPARWPRSLCTPDSMDRILPRHRLDAPMTVPPHYRLAGPNAPRPHRLVGPTASHFLYWLDGPNAASLH